MEDVEAAKYDPRPEAQAVEVPPVNQAYDALAQEQENVRKLVQALGDRLAPVLGPTVGTPDDDVVDDEEAAPLVEWLRERRRFERHTRETLEYLLSRLAV